MVMEYKNLKQLFDAGVVRLAKIPPKNEYPIEKLDQLAGYTVPLIAHDYFAKTPIMWNTVYEKLGLNLRNIMVVPTKEHLEPEDVKNIMAALRNDPKYLGGGAGVGFKEAVIPYLDKVVPDDLKAVNIIVKEGTQLVGYNTDAKGFVKSLMDKVGENGSTLTDKYVVLFGAGGVAKPLVDELAQHGIKRLQIINRTGEKAAALAQYARERYKIDAYGNDETIIRGISLNIHLNASPGIFINATDKGSDGKLIEYACFAEAIATNNSDSLTILRELKRHHPRCVIADVAMNKRGKTRTLELAEAAGFEEKQLLDGVPMVINQAAPAYKLVEKSHPQLHGTRPLEDEILAIMKQAARSAK